MKVYILVLTLAAVLNVSMARPPSVNDDDFSIDMYEGANHLRYERSSDHDETTHEEAAVEEDLSSGTTVTIDAENVDAEHAIKQQHQTVEIPHETLDVKTSMDLVQNVMTNLESKASEGQQTSVDSNNVHLHQEAAAAPAAAAAVAAPTAVEKASEDSPTAISKSSTKTELSHGQQQSTEGTVELAKPRYLFQYGEVLNRINADKISPLASKSRAKASAAKSKKLSKGKDEKEEKNTGSVSYLFVNGKEYTGTDPSNMVMSKSGTSHTSHTSHDSHSARGPAPFIPPAGFGAPSSFGPQFSGYGGPAFSFHGAPQFSPMYGAVHDQTRNLKSNLKSAFHGFREAPRGIQMLGFHRPQSAPFQAASSRQQFRPF